MKSLPSLLAELRGLDSTAPNYVQASERALAEVIALASAEIVSPLLSMFDDSSPYDELMFSMIHGIEAFDDETYVEQVLGGSVDLCARAPRWASVIFIRMLNSEPTRLELIRQLRNSHRETKAVVGKLVEQINARAPQLLAKTVAVQLAAGQ